MPENGALLSLRGVSKRFRRPALFGMIRESGPNAVHAVDLEVRRGEVVGLIGESGSGKTTLARVAVGLLPRDAGRVELFGRTTDDLSGVDWLEIRKRVQLLIQNPRGSLNPGLTVRQHLVESVRLHRPGADVAGLVDEAASAVGLETRLDALPGELSGGEQRRVGIARVMIAQPEILVADEPTTGLDASLKADLIDLLLSGRGPDRGYLLISHDLALVRYACDRVVVLHAGAVVEEFLVARLGEVRHHPYTRSLLEAASLLPRSGTNEGVGAVGRIGQGCSFAGACPLERGVCRTSRPKLSVGDGEGHRRACAVLEHEGTL